MRKKVLAGIFSLLLVVSMSGIAAATMVQDNGGAPGDNYVAGKDLKAAGVRLSDEGGPSDCPDYAYLSIEMESGSTMPGAIAWDFDVDPAKTDGGSILVMPFATAEGGGTGPYKPTTRGFEFLVLMTLRMQGDTGNNAVGANCFGSSGTCVTQGAACTGCVEADCYQINEDCDPGEPDCYILGDGCTGCTEGDCYVINEDCVAGTPCGKGMLEGEWYASYGVQQGPLSRGRIDVDQDFRTILTKNKYMFKIPYAYIISEIWDRYPPGGKFSLNEACGGTHTPQFQVILFHDTAYTDQEDFMDTNGGIKLNIADYLPNTDGVKADVDYASANYFCRCDFDDDGNVYPADLSVFLGDYGRTNCISIRYQ